MAITTSRGYPGLVTASDYAILSRHQGQSYAVLAHDHLVVSKGTGDRGVKISDGTGLGHGVMDVNVGDVNLNALIMGSAGSRWDTVALERDWATKTSSLVLLAGNSSKTISAARLRNVGTGKDHQPLALVRVENGKTDIQDFVDLRVWQQDGGLYAADPLARDYMDALGTDMLCKNEIRYIRVLDPVSGLPVWSEHRKTPFGERPFLQLYRAAGYTGLWSDVGYHAIPDNIVKHGDADACFAYTPGSSSSNGAVLTVKKSGVYSMTARAWLSGGGAYYANLSFEGDYIGISAQDGRESGFGFLDLFVHETRWLPEGAKFKTRMYTSAPVTVRNWGVWFTRLGD